MEECKKNYLSTLEKNLNKILKWRNYEEIFQAKAVIEKIIKNQDQYKDTIDPIEIEREFKNEEKKLQRKLKLIFPKINRWANIATMLSIPFAITGIAKDSSLITIAGASTAGISQLTKELLQLFESKYRWVTFLPQIRSSCYSEKTESDNSH